MRTDRLNKKVTDFITLEEGNIGRRSAVVTGALLASSVLGTVLASLTPTAEGYYEHCDEHYNRAHSNYHSDIAAHNDHQNCGWACPCD